MMSTSLSVIYVRTPTGKSLGDGLNGVDLPQWCCFNCGKRVTNEVFDLELMKDASAIGDELLNTLKLALHCVDPSPSARPEVQLVLQQLEEIRPETTTSSGDDGGAGPSMRAEITCRIFRFLEGQPRLGIWNPKDSPFDLVAYTDSDNAGASLDRKSTIGGALDPKSIAGLWI
ncbi:hypothetical protein Tco_1320447 [Tanacetum coccineum]